MSLVTMNGAELSTATVSREYLQGLASNAGIVVPEHDVDDFRVILTALDKAAEYVLTLEDYVPKVDLALYPRSDIHIPEDSKGGGWATKATVISTAPLSDELKGRTIALKDNIAVAGVRCTNGTAALDWTPDVDATVVTRMLDAGGIITGKATCENNCIGAVSDTSCTGPVHNPYAANYSSGGSSSGSGRLVAIGEVDMALGCDQGGSIRLPSSNCGLVGLKPTWGLVPYTGIISLEATIDHVGPMTKNVRDCALLMDVISGSDGIDDRTPCTMKPGTFQNVKKIDEMLATSSETWLKGLKVGILKEGFMDPCQNADIEALVKSAANDLKAFGAEVSECSIPMHLESGMIWMCALPIAGMRQGLLADVTGRKQLYLTERTVSSGKKLSQAAFDALGAGGQNIYLRGLFMDEKYGPAIHARTGNLLRKLNDEYDRALREYDVLVMPTMPRTPPKILKDMYEGGVLERLARTVGVNTNTSPFNSSGHPGLSLPVGFVAAAEDEKVFLPTGMQIIGRKFEDLLCMKVAATWEKTHDWKTYKA